jgi:hypothetical protein
MRPGVLVCLTTIAGTLTTAAFFYPGFLSGDSNWQYLQAVSGVYDDWHPVLTAFLWRQLDRVIPGSGGLFLLTALAFWLGLSLAVRSFHRSAASYLAPVVFIGALYTPVTAMLSQVGKDAAMGAALLLGYALLQRGERRASLGMLLLAALALWVATGLRYNAPAAVLPLAIWLGWLIARDHAPPGWRRRLAPAPRRIALGLALFALLFGSSRAASEWILGERGTRHAIHQLLFAYDIVGVSVRSGESHLPSFYWESDNPFAEGGRPYTLEELEALYDPQTNIWLHWGEEPERRLALFEEADGEALDALASAWLGAIASEPLAYLRHRGELFLAMLGLLPDSPIHGVHFNVEEHYAYRGPRVFDLPHSRWLVGELRSERGSLVFRPWLYLALSLVWMLAAWRSRSAHRGPVWILGASSLCYTLPYLVVGVAADYRYLWWPVLVALLQAVILFDGLGRGERSSVG